MPFRTPSDNVPVFPTAEALIRGALVLTLNVHDTEALPMVTERATIYVLVSIYDPVLVTHLTESDVQVFLHFSEETNLVLNDIEHLFLLLGKVGMG
jgi:hypothetical protein